MHRRLWMPTPILLPYGLQIIAVNIFCWHTQNEWPPCTSQIDAITTSVQGNNNNNNETMANRCIFHVGFFVLLLLLGIVRCFIFLMLRQHISVNYAGKLLFLLLFSLPMEYRFFSDARMPHAIFGFPFE